MNYKKHTIEEARESLGLGRDDDYMDEAIKLLEAYDMEKGDKKMNYKKVLEENDLTLKDLIIFCITDTDALDEVLENTYIDLTTDEKMELKEDIYKLILKRI